VAVDAAIVAWQAIFIKKNNDSYTYVELLKKKKAEYPSYRKARERMQELMKAQKNVEMFFADNRSEQEQQQTR
jgi:hypothetical protein